MKTDHDQTATKSAKALEKTEKLLQVVLELHTAVQKSANENISLEQAVSLLKQENALLRTRLGMPRHSQDKKYAFKKLLKKENVMELPIERILPIPEELDMRNKTIRTRLIHAFGQAKPKVEKVGDLSKPFGRDEIAGMKLRSISKLGPRCEIMLLASLKHFGIEPIPEGGGVDDWGAED